MSIAGAPWGRGSRWEEGHGVLGEGREGREVVNICMVCLTPGLACCGREGPVINTLYWGNLF